MQFHKFTGLIKNYDWEAEEGNRRAKTERSRRLCVTTESINRDLKKDAFIFISDDSDGLAEIGVLTAGNVDLNRLIDSFLSQNDLGLETTELSEITFEEWKDMLNTAGRRGFVRDAENVLEAFDLEILNGRYRDGIEFGENILETKEKDEVFKAVDSLVTGSELYSELERIYTSSAIEGISGHPVHYMIQRDDRETRKGMCRILLEALHGCGRIRNRRYCYVDVGPGDRVYKYALECLYKSNAGGAVIIRFTPADENAWHYAGGQRENIEILCEIMKKYRSSVLTVFCFPKECTGVKDIFWGNLGNTTFVEINEEFVSGDKARRFLEMLAERNNMKPDEKLFSKIEDSREYLSTELSEFFEDWSDNVLKTGVYPQYSEFTANISKAVKEEPRGNAYDELQKMIGLDEVKKVIDRAVNYFKFQALFEQRGVPQDNPSMHMVFTGNPGTAKTTVARLFAGILRENRILSKGHMVEVGRSDLVGKYVGWTASIVKDKFRDAMGGVLFIDEAYSLVDDKDGLFGDEAINTIVQEMENHRNDTVMIFAGYPDKMESFLRKNPGLRSRIAYHVPFSDYDPDSLCRIAELIAEKKGYSLTDGAVGKLSEIFETARKDSDFGNGRYARNVIEKAQMSLAERLISADAEKLKDSDFTTITEEDIEIPPAAVRVSERRIGF